MAKKFWMAAILTIHTSICRPCGGIVRSAKAYECGKCDVANGIPRYSDFRNVSTYTDNGFIGLNFDRPAMRQLQADVDAGLVGVVLVKDISRISRN
ncbi:MAG: recombinase family protein, partial [Defluviitaleaceae bacterium]|nr:recombinase family protein [Defluviitaleaceae bacterium]MCL2263266.1 recombinase family protein [Defluviitaleaceae bacterium]